ncbi:MAG: Mce-associated rane protein [Pseudonocardiales bacterium]|nr:Mce-associated rane protein [Pseudonocardiales bacterium]
MARFERHLRAVTLMRSAGLRSLAAAALAMVSRLGRSARRLWTQSRLVAVILLTVAVVLVAAAGLLGWRDRGYEQTAQARAEAVLAASKDLAGALSYDYRSIDKDIASARLGMTGSFEGNYDRFMRSVVAPVAQKQQIVTRAVIVRTAIALATSSKVVVLAFVNQTTTSTQAQGQQINGSRVEVTLVPVGGKWLISEMTPV